MVFCLSFEIEVSSTTGSATHLERRGHMAPPLERRGRLLKWSIPGGGRISSTAWFQSVDHSKLVKFGSIQLEHFRKHLVTFESNLFHCLHGLAKKAPAIPAVCFHCRENAGTVP